MPRPGYLTLLAAFIATPAIFWSGPVAAQMSASAEYVVTLGGVNVARVVADLSEAGQQYDLDIEASVAGLGNIITSGQASASASGTVSGNELASNSFQLATRAGGESFDVSVDYTGRNVSAFQVDPPVPDQDRVPLERSHLSGVGDMLSAFVLRGDTLGPELCNRNMRVFTGIERFDVAMSYARAEEATSPRTGYQGPVMLCTLDYQPVSGHFETSEITSYLAETDRILLWYAPLGDTGYFVPYRALIGTGAGDLSMVLTGMNF